MEALSIKSLTGGSSSSDAKFVGNVTNGSSFPTTRLDGSALHEGDYVRPKTGSTFPFIIGSVTFTSTRDKAIYSTAGWMIDPGALQDTVETPVKDKTVESLSGNSTTQYAINVENKDAIAGKVNRDTSGADVVYSRINNTDNNQTISKSATANTVAWRGDNGTLKVGNPTDNMHAVNKQTFDNAVDNKVDKSTSKTVFYGTDADGKQIVKSYSVAKSSHSAMIRDDAGRTQVGTPVEGTHAANKDYVDAQKTVVDSAISSTSTNPVQNKVIKAALDDEATTRANADTTIQNNLTSEISNRQNADLTLQNNIDSEATARANADNTEATTRSNADTTLQNNIDNEALARTNAIDNEALIRSNKDTDLQDQINNLSTIGRYLSTWNASIGKPATEPATMPYNYKSGDYYIINGVGVTNYRPTGAQYTGVASTTVETEDIANNGFYQYDGTSWIYLAHAAKDVTFSTIGGSPYENANLKTALDAKANVTDLNTHTTNATVHVTSADKTNWNAKANQTDLDTHTNNADIHVTATDKTGWNNHIADTDIHVTAAKKTEWDAKANQTDLDTHTNNDDIHVTIGDKTNWSTKQNALTEGDGISLDSDIVSVKVDGTTIEVDPTDGLQVKNNSIKKSHISSTANVVYKNDAQTLTNKTIDADSNTLSNLEVSNFKDTAIGNDILADPVPTRLSTNEAVYKYGKCDEVTIDRDPTDGIYLVDADTYLHKDDVVDNLISTDVDKPLSANQGKVLQDTKQNKITISSEAPSGGSDGDIWLKVM